MPSRPKPPSRTTRDELAPVLVAHFGYLLDGPGHAHVLAAVMAYATSLTRDGERWRVGFPGERTLEATPPAARATWPGWPSSWAALVGVHEELSFPDDGGWSLILGDHGNFEPAALAGSELPDGGADLDALRSPLRDFSDWWVYRPGGARGLVYVSHEGGAPQAHPWTPGVVFLRRMAELLELDVALPSPPTGDAAGN